MWTFRRRKNFKKSYDGLTAEQKKAVREAWPRVKEDPFNPQFGTHQIQRLRTFYGRTVYSVVLMGDLRTRAAQQARLHRQQRCRTTGSIVAC